MSTTPEGEGHSQIDLEPLIGLPQVVPEPFYLTAGRKINHPLFVAGATGQDLPPHRSNPIKGGHANLESKHADLLKSRHFSN